MLAAILLILGNIFIFALSYWYIHRETKVALTSPHTEDNTESARNICDNPTLKDLALLVLIAIPILYLSLHWFHLFHASGLAPSSPVEGLGSSLGVADISIILAIWLGTIYLCVDMASLFPAHVRQSDSLYPIFSTIGSLLAYAFYEPITSHSTFLSYFDGVRNMLAAGVATWGLVWTIREWKGMRSIRKVAVEFAAVHALLAGAIVVAPYSSLGSWTGEFTWTELDLRLFARGTEGFFLWAMYHAWFWIVWMDLIKTVHDRTLTTLFTARQSEKKPLLPLSLLDLPRASGSVPRYLFLGLLLGSSCGIYYNPEIQHVESWILTGAAGLIISGAAGLLTQTKEERPRTHYGEKGSFH